MKAIVISINFLVYLPPLKEKTSVNSPKPKDSIGWLEVLQLLTFPTKKHSKTFKKFRGGCLNDCSSSNKWP